MKMKRSFGERLMIFIEYKKLNKNSFSKSIGLENNSLIVKIINDPTMGSSTNLLEKIANAYPELNMNWLLFEREEMIRHKNQIDPKHTKIKYYQINVEPVELMRINGYEDCDHAFDVYGDMMVPKYQPGDIIICKDVSLSQPIAFGEAHLLFINNNQIIRYIKSMPEPGQIKLGAENPRYEDAVIRTIDIGKAYLIKGLIRREAF
jgi:hypothetical protein